ncbi:methionine synthase [Corynebacterium sp. 335C]
MTAFAGLGPMPGTDPVQAADVIGGESGGVVHLPVLPARGLGAGPVARTGAMLADLPLDRGPRGLRVASSRAAGTATHLGAVARDLLDADADACEAAWGTAPDVVRLPAVGPLTMAAVVELPAGHRMLTDMGATRYLAEALGEGLRARIADARRRHGARVVVQLDEAVLDDVLRGAVPDATGGATLPALGRIEAAALLRAVIDPVRDAGAAVTLRPATPPDRVSAGAIAEAAPDAVWVRAGRVTGTERLDCLGELLSGGVRPELGVVPDAPEAGRDPVTGAWIAPDERGPAQAAARLWDELSFPRAELAGDVTLTPAGGFERQAADWPAMALRCGRRAAELVARAAGDL